MNRDVLKVEGQEHWDVLKEGQEHFCASLFGKSCKMVPVFQAAPYNSREQHCLRDRHKTPCRVQSFKTPFFCEKHRQNIRRIKTEFLSVPVCTHRGSVGKLVNPFASHAKDPQFEPGRNQITNVICITHILLRLPTQ